MIIFTSSSSSSMGFNRAFMQMFSTSTGLTRPAARAASVARTRSWARMPDRETRLFMPREWTCRRPQSPEPTQVGGMNETCRLGRAACDAAVHAAVAGTWPESRPHAGLLARGLCDCNTASHHLHHCLSSRAQPHIILSSAGGQISTASGLHQNIHNTG